MHGQRQDYQRIVQDEYYNIIQKYNSSEDYNDEIIRDARNYYLIYDYNKPAYDEYVATHLIPADLAFCWESNQDRENFKEIRKRKQNNVIYDNLAVSAIVVNHIVSAISASSICSKMNKRNLGSLSVMPDFSTKSMVVQYGIKF